MTSPNKTQSSEHDIPESPAGEPQEKTDAVSPSDLGEDVLKATLDAALGAVQEDEAVEVPSEPAEADMFAEYELKLAEMKDQLLRAVAETENVRRRAARDVEESGKYAISGFARDLLSVSENLHLALQSIPEEVRAENEQLKNLAQGVEMTQRELLSVFERHGIQRIDPLGQKFDHNFHQAISQVEDPTKEPGTILQVLQAGYILRDRLLRPAMVVVSKQGEPESRVDTQA